MSDEIGTGMKARLRLSLERLRLRYWRELDHALHPIFRPACPCMWGWTGMSVDQWGLGPSSEPVKSAVTRSADRTYGTDGDVTVEAIHWPDGTATLRAHRWDHDGEHMWWLCGCPEPDVEP